MSVKCVIINKKYYKQKCQQDDNAGLFVQHKHNANYIMNLFVCLQLASTNFVRRYVSLQFRVKNILFHTMSQGYMYPYTSNCKCLF